tara:strand:+ start:151 stop:450 length:300 start_codon:yes stop_codon:yes gene_type:complete
VEDHPLVGLVVCYRVDLVLVVVHDIVGDLEEVHLSLVVVLCIVDDLEVDQWLVMVLFLVVRLSLVVLFLEVLRLQEGLQQLVYLPVEPFLHSFLTMHQL